MGGLGLEDTFNDEIEAAERLGRKIENSHEGATETGDPGTKYSSAVDIHENSAFPQSDARLPPERVKFTSRSPPVFTITSVRFPGAPFGGTNAP